MNMFKPRPSFNIDDINGTLPVLPLPQGSVLLPSSNLAVQLFRQDSINMLEAVLDEADKKGRPEAAILAATPFSIPSSSSSSSNNSKALVKKGDASPRSSSSSSSPPPKSPLTVNTGNGNTASGDGAKPDVNQLSEYACAARILRVEKLEVQVNGKIENGYLVILEGLARIRIDRFTLTGTPFFEAQVKAFPRRPASEDPVDPALADNLRAAAQRILETLEAALSPLNKGKPLSKKVPLPSIAPKLSEFALKSLKASINRLNAQTADELSDILISSLLPTSRPESFSIKLHHLSLITNANQRVSNAIAQLDILNAGLKAREGVDERFNRAEQRKAREGVLKGLLDSIIQELRALKKEEADDLGIPSTPPPTSLRPKGHSHSNTTDEDLEDEDEEEEDDDELHTIKQKIKQSKTMPDETKKLCLKELKRLEQIPPMSPEFGKAKDYLDWMINLPWNKSTFDLPESYHSKIDKEFLERARQTLEDDHFGIENVKLRLLQYLAVLRLKHEQWEEDEAKLVQKEEEEEKEAALAKQKQIQDTEAKDDDKKEGEDSPRDRKMIGPAPKSEDVNQPSSPTKKKAPVVKQKPRQFRDKGPILCLVGPPGVGKTSIARSLATAMGRPFSRAALGGISDEADIRGFRRTYVGSAPGLFIQKLRQVGVNNPVILLDEIDKIAGGSSTRGDPAAALLEVLDPEQNHTFTDHYINHPVDLSSVLFIATANSLDTIPGPLLDRMEVIHLSGYVDVEKLQIARKYLLPKQLKANSLQPAHVRIDDDTILAIVNRYCHESGVRTLERRIGSVCRWKAVELARARDQLSPDQKQSVGALEVNGYDPTVKVEDLETILGHNYKLPDQLDDENHARPGCSVGLGYTGDGNGCLLFVEATSMPGQGNLRLTGSLGDVIKESAHIALSWIKANAYDLGLAERDQNIMEGIDIHLHMPEGAIKKDGPSAGVAMTLCLLSLFSGQPLDTRLAMTGEITLRGKVGAVGGIKEKCLAAARAGIKRLILPEACRSTAMADLPQKIRDEIEIAFVDNAWQAIEYAFPTKSWNLPGPKASERKPVARMLNKL